MQRFTFRKVHKTLTAGRGGLVLYTKTVHKSHETQAAAGRPDVDCLQAGGSPVEYRGVCL